jgi:hypothetical protein
MKVGDQYDTLSSRREIEKRVIGIRDRESLHQHGGGRVALVDDPQRAINRDEGEITHYGQGCRFVY